MVGFILRQLTYTRISYVDNIWPREFIRIEIVGSRNRAYPHIGAIIVALIGVLEEKSAFCC